MGLTQLRTMGVEMEAKTHEVSSDDGHLWTADVTTKEDTRVWTRKLEAIDRQQSGPVSLVHILSERSDLSCRSHLCITSATLTQASSSTRIRTNTEERISTGKSSPRELRDLNCDVVTLLSHQIDRLWDVDAYRGQPKDL